MKTKVFTLLFVLVSINCAAQKKEPRFGIELSGYPSVALKKLDDAKMKVGLGFEGTFHYRFYRDFGLYAGWGWNHFSTDNSFDAQKCDFEETGYVFGLQFKRKINNSLISYYVRAGALWNHIEIEDSDGEQIKDTKHGLGYQLAGGIYIPIWKSWCVNTGVKFHSLNRKNIDFTDNTEKSLDLKYLSLRVGIIKMF